MPTALTHADALGIYYTGAAVAGATQRDPAACLGGHRAADELWRLGFELSQAVPTMPSLLIDQIMGWNGAGTATLRASGTSELRYTPPGGSEGAAVTIADGETKLLEGATVSQAIRVTRDGTTDLGGLLTFDTVEIFNNPVGSTNATPSGAAIDTYGALMLRAHGGLPLTTVRAWVKTLGTQRTSNGSQLGGAGAGTVGTTGSLADWPTPSGYCHIKTAAGATREVVYYTSRTGTTVTVPANGRGLLGTVAGAGLATDTMDAVPGIRIGYEVPNAAGAIQTILNENTAPAAITWDTGTTSTTGLSYAALAANTNLGLWIHRHVPDGATATARVENAINLDFVSAAVTYTEKLTGLYRVGDTALARYELFLGEDVDPDFVTPVDTSATLPFSYALAPPLIGTLEYRAVVRQRNQYDLSNFNLWTRKFVIDDAGLLVVPTPSPPDNIALTGTAGGMVTVSATYNPDHDETQADTWLIYYRGDGTDPTVGVDTPLVITMTPDLFFGSPQRRLNYSLGPFGLGTDLHVLVRTRKATGSVDSTNTTIVQLTVATTDPMTPTRRRLYWGANAEQRIAPPTVNRTIVIDAGNSIEHVMGVGYTELWADGSLLWRLRYDSAGPSNNGFWTTFGIRQEVISGAPADTPVEVDEWNGQKTIYVIAGGVRRMKLDVTAGTIHFTALRSVPAQVVTCHSDDPIIALAWHTCFQVFDPASFQYMTVASLDSTGVLATLIPWRQRNNSGDFE